MLPAQTVKEILMVDPVLHSVAKSPKANEANPKGKAIDPRVAELLQSIYTVSRIAATSIGLGKAVDSAKDLQDFVDPGEVLEFSIESGYEAINKVWSEAEELAKLLDIDLEKPTSYRLKPVFAEK
jgi:hypothetical protein